MQVADDEVATGLVGRMPAHNGMCQSVIHATNLSVINIKHVRARSLSQRYFGATFHSRKRQPAKARVIHVKRST
jgi:hypothetical protein